MEGLLPKPLTFFILGPSAPNKFLQQPSGSDHGLIVGYFLRPCGVPIDMAQGASRSDDVNVPVPFVRYLH